MNEFIKGILTGAVGGMFLKHFWDKLKGRITVLYYDIESIYLGATIGEETDNRIKVSFNNTTVPNLYGFLITIKNDGNKDLNNIKFEICCDNESAILLKSALKNNGPLSLPAVPINDLAKINDDPYADFRYTSFMAEVFNRGEQIVIALLGTSLPNKRPIITLLCSHTGVILKPKRSGQKILDENFYECIMVGYISAIMLFMIVFRFVDNKLIFGILVAAIFALATIIGLLIKKIFKYLIRALS